MITEKAFRDSARIIGCDVPAIKAVAKVESGGSGIVNGVPVILYEPHIFFSQLREHGVNPLLYATKRMPVKVKGKVQLMPIDDVNNPILYSIWGAVPYPKGQAAQQERLARAVKIHREAALMSASWGRFQIMGFNFARCGCNSVQEFVNKMYQSEDEQLNLFTNYILSAGLADELRDKRWAAFAYNYNGSGYAANKYDVKLANAYKTFSV